MNGTAWPADLPVEVASDLMDLWVEVASSLDPDDKIRFWLRLFGPWFDLAEFPDPQDYCLHVVRQVTDYQQDRDLDDLHCALWLDKGVLEELAGSLYRPDVPGERFPTEAEFVADCRRRGQAYLDRLRRRAPIVVNHWARPPEPQFEFLCIIEPRFAQAYQRNRPDLNNDQSRIDYSLACWALRAGWSSQQVADLITASRRDHCKRRDDQRKGRRRDYLILTIDKARKDTGT